MNSSTAFRIFRSRIIKGSVSHCRTVTGPKREMELPGTEEEINFDGSFLLGPMRPDNFTLAPLRFAEIKKDMQSKSPEEIDAYLKNYCQRFTTERVSCYCNSCLSGLVQGLPEGKRAVHVAELLFP